MRVHIFTFTSFLILFLLCAACKSESPQQGDRQENITTEHAKLRIALSFSGYDKPLDPELRAEDGEPDKFYFDVKDGNGKHIRIDKDGYLTSDGSEPSPRAHLNQAENKKKHPSLKFLCLLRDKRTKRSLGSFCIDWTYGLRGTDTWYADENENVSYSSIDDKSQVQIRIAIGGDMNENSQTLSIKDAWAVYDRSTNVPVAIPVPFVSDWVDLDFQQDPSGDESANRFIVHSKKPIKLKPQGVLITTAVRNNMSEDVEISGVRYVSNCLQFVGTFNLAPVSDPSITEAPNTKAPDEITFEPDAPDYTMNITGDKFYTAEYDYDEPQTIKHDGKNAPQMFISWAMPTKDAPEPRAWDSGSGAGRDHQFMYAQTHVYAVDASVSKPNYDVVPIMGTMRQFQSGKTTTFNCELYNQPTIILGHLAQHTVNDTGDGFDINTNHNDVSFVHYTRAKAFASPDGKSVYSPHTQQKNVFKMGDKSLAFMLMLFWGANWVNEGYFKWYDPNDHSKGAVYASNTGVRSTLYHRPDGSLGSHSVFFQRVRNGESSKIIYAIYNRENNFGSPYTMRSGLNQELWRTERTTDPTVQFTGMLTYKAIYLGKYFVGSVYSPINSGHAGNDEWIWNNSEATANLVSRVLPAPGHYDKSGDASSSDKGFYENVDEPVYPGSYQKSFAGLAPLYWFADNYGPNPLVTFMYKYARGENPQFNGKQWIEWMQKANNDNIILWLPGGGTSMRGVHVDAKFMWLPLITYSDTYQGDHVTDIPSFGDLEEGEEM